MHTPTFIRNAFPVPRIFSLSTMSLDISDGVFRFFECSRMKGRLVPKSWGVYPFPILRKGLQSEGAEATTAAGKALARFASERNLRFVKAIIHEGDAYVFKVTIPTSAPEEMHSAIEASLEGNVPLSPEEALFEYEVVSVDHVRGQTTVAVSVVSQKVVSDYITVLESGSLIPVDFDIESRSIARAVIEKGDTRLHIVLSVHARHSVVFVVENGVVTFSSSLEVGSVDLDRAAQKADSGDSFESIIPVFSVIRDQIAKVISYCKADIEKTGKEVSDIILIGSATAVPGVARYISMTSKLPVKSGSVWTNVLSPDTEVPDLNQKDSLDYAALIGIHL